ncbi:hypothetical protein RIEGSTA812A_PEG_930 [invertebrate metagenome]|uniref:Uncharacterized protein n=1 Tax=invertebrate metagenome TaxID=1711999 RepID=A0A484H5W1_9ZZZZ
MLDQSLSALNSRCALATVRLSKRSHSNDLGGQQLSSCDVSAVSRS